MKKKLLIVLTMGVIGVSTGLGIGLWLIFSGTANEDLATGTILMEGTFIEFDSAHYGSGTARIVRLPNDNRQLQFVNVDIAPGPDLYVYLSNKTSFSGIGDGPGVYIDLGLLPFNVGTFSMNIQAMVNLSNVHSVLIWCKQFSVAFTYATLT